MENNNGKGIFYGVIGVATLVVAIIGATFAYFSATVTPTEGADAIEGQTNQNFASTLSLNVEKMLTPSTGINNDLVPANITASTTSITTAVNANCEASGYTGCHLYRITGSADQAVSNANINLVSLTTTDVTAESSWKYALFTATETTGTFSNVALVTGGYGAFPVSTSFDMHNASLTANVPAVYYLLVWIENNASASQNNEDNNDATGSYSGSVTMQAAGGQVSATFGT